MELSRAIASMAVVLAIVLAAGYAVGEDAAPAGKMTAQQKVEAREAQRLAALAEQQKRKDAFDRSCNKPLKTGTDYDLCRAAYRALTAASK
jgi:hypothetical protein